MVTHYLEKLIHQGKARFRTFVCGTSGSNVLPVQDNTWIVITGFTYINFSDPLTPIPGADFDAYIRRSIHQLRFRSSKSNNSYILKDEIRRDVGDPGSDSNQIPNGDFANAGGWDLGVGWTIAGGAATHSGAAGATFIISDFFVPKPGRQYRLTYEVVTIVGAPTVTPAIGVTMGVTRSTLGTFTEYIVAPTSGVAAALSFLGAGGAGNDISIDNVELILMPGDSVTTINGHYKFDCYLPHQNEVSVELVAFPNVPGILTTLAAAPESLSLPAPPVGYGNAGFGGIAQVSEFTLTLAPFPGPPPGLFGIGLPLTRIHTDPVQPLAHIIQNGMEIGVSAATAIQPPDFTEDQQIRDFPIVDIQYVEITGNMPGDIQASS